jgi:hypothetical protein
MRALIVLAVALLGCADAHTPKIALNPKTGTIDVMGLRTQELDRLRQSKPEWTQIFTVRSGTTIDASTPSMLGSYEVTANAVVFHPRFPLVADLPYHVRFQDLETTILLPKKPTSSTTVVAQVFPSGDELPANQLKFYLYFSKPMSIGNAYDSIRLLDDSGREVPRAFLQTSHELWDARRERFTLILDPGRIKRGLRANVEDGTPVRTGGNYRLVIDAAWPDGDGNPLRASFEKPFRVLAADRTAPDPQAWRVSAPAAGTSAALQLQFDEPLDRSLLEEMLVVLDEKNNPLLGELTITGGETQWQFRPRQPWRKGRYAVLVDAKIEDRAGNNLQRLFDEDVRAAQHDAPESITLPFVISEATTARSSASLRRD